MTSRSGSRVAALLAASLTLCAALPSAVHAGGPLYVAGVSVFNPGTAGTPLTWDPDTITYYTDQGDLSSQLPGAMADAFVAQAFNRWSSIATAAIAVNHGGQLAENVSGANVTLNSDGSINMPADILPSAVAFPVGVVYDEDGAVTDALLGTGASSPTDCFTNAVFGGPDNLGPNAFFLHALVVLNGNCAQTTAELPDVQYRLVRVLGQVLGLGWSQVNPNVLTGNPTATPADYAGFPLMHAVDPISCVPIARCYPAEVDPIAPKMDDQAALSRLYPVTTQNQSSIPGRQLSSAATAHIYGSVYFIGPGGQAGQPMEGVNVVARWVDPSTNLPSRTYAAACVSGFLFTGNAGNQITGMNDSTGQPYNRFGASDPTLEGFFDLPGLQIPDGSGQGQFELTVEALDPVWSKGVGPYDHPQVAPSGSVRVFVFANQGQEVEQDLVMQDSAISSPNWFGTTTFASPAPVPAAGDWLGALNPYGDSDYFSLSAQANRTLSVSVTALDESGAPSESKAQPVIGIWTLADTGTSPAPANTPSALNTFFTGETRLDAMLNTSTNFRIGIADFRGDGRPDFRYRARVFYGDTVSPARASVAGGTPLAVQGLGFNGSTTASIGPAASPVLAFSANQLLLTAPASADGVQNVSLSDPTTGGTSAMTQVLTYGAGPNDTILLISGSSTPTPVGAQTATPIVVQVVAADGETPVDGASVCWSSASSGCAGPIAAPPAAFSACGEAANCTVLTDQSGLASTYATVLAQGAITIYAQLAPASYNPPQQVLATLNGTESALDIGLAPQFAWVGQNATLALPLSARVLSNGAPVANSVVDFGLKKGAALFASSATTDNNGLVNNTAQLSSLSGDVQISACVKNTPFDAPCLALNITAVPASALQLQPVAGSLQITPVNQSFQPVTVRVTDNSTPPHPVAGVSVIFQSLVARAPQNQPIIWIGDTGITGNPMPVVLASSEVTVQSDENGLAGITPSAGGVQGPVVILGSASAGASTSQFQLQSLAPVNSPAASDVAAKNAPAVNRNRILPRKVNGPENRPREQKAGPL